MDQKVSVKSKTNEDRYLYSGFAKLLELHYEEKNP